ncbi:MAG: T9SS type A sorting domain-containing protein [Bacteroidales bacterium]|nr:T9SS type A sorting domain-containing protein [Bacteroidales bacterium]
MKQLYKIKILTAIAIVFFVTAGLFGQTTFVQIWVLYERGFENVAVERTVPNDDISTQDPAMEVISFYPNPARDVLNIRANNIRKIEIINMMGTIVISTSGSGNSHTLDISGLTPGLYFIRVTTDTGVSIGRFIKQ